MSFLQFLSILRARWRTAAAVLAAVVLFVLALSLLLPKKYTATASLVVDAKPDPLNAFAYQTGANSALMATQVDIVQSDRVARRVVRSLKFGDNAQIRELWQSDTGGRGDIETWLVKRLTKDLEVRPAKESNVISVSYDAPDPVFAAAVANAFAGAYVDTVLELRVDPAKQFNAFFDARAQESRASLETAQSRLSAFQRDNGVVTTDERLDVETQRLNELSSQLVLIQSISAEASSRQAQATSGAADKMQEVTNNPVVAALRADMSRQEARLQEISARLGENNPQVIELKANISELRQRIDSEVRRLSAGVGISGNISRQREAQIRAELEAQRVKVLKMKKVREEGELIQRDVENAQRAYDQIVQRRIQTSLESQATASNVSLLSPAVPPIEASSPKIILNTIVAVFLGLLLGCGVAVLREMLDRRLRSADDVAEILALPVLAVLSGATPPGRTHGPRLGGKHLLVAASGERKV